MELHEKLQQQYKAIQEIKKGINVIENKAIIMMQFINAETEMAAIHLFSLTIDNNIDLYELTSAYTWFILGYNYLTQQPLDRYDSDLYQKQYFKLYPTKEGDLTQEETFQLFREFYNITLEELSPNESPN